MSRYRCRGSWDGRWEQSLADLPKEIVSLMSRLWADLGSMAAARGFGSWPSPLGQLPVFPPLSVSPGRQAPPFCRPLEISRFRRSVERCLEPADHRGQATRYWASKTSGIRWWRGLLLSRRNRPEARIPRAGRWSFNVLRWVWILWKSNGSRR